MADNTNVQDSEDQVVETTDDNTPAVEEGTAAAETLKPGAGSAGAGDRMQKIADLIGLLSDLSDKDLNNYHASIAQIGHEADPLPAGANGAANRNTIKAKASAAMGKIVKEDLNKLFESDENLSEDFRNNAVSLFEAAVSLRVSAEVADLEEEYNTQLDEAKDIMVQQFSERLDTYFAYVADKYIDENKLAIESGIRSELTESFLQGMRQLFDEHYVEVPEEKIDVIEGYETQIEELEEQLQNATTRNIELTSVLEQREKKVAIDALAEGLTEADREKLENILEDVDYSDLEDFNKKATLIKENYFGSEEGVVTESTGLVLNEVEGDDETATVKEEKKVPAHMERYVQAIRRDLRENGR
jgi:hypothetical protein